MPESARYSVAFFDPVEAQQYLDRELAAYPPEGYDTIASLIVSNVLRNGQPVPQYVVKINRLTSCD